MINEAITRPFPENLFYDLGINEPTEQAEDFLGTLMYVLRVVANARDSRTILMRYKDGKTFDEIGIALDLTKQRAHALVQSIMDKITGDYTQMLVKGMKKYYEDLFMERVSHLTNVIESSEREEIKKKAFAEGYESGYKDGLSGNRGNTVSIDVLDTISIHTMSLSVRTFNALEKNGVRTLGDVVRIGDNIINFRTFGKKCFDEIAKLLESYGVRVVRTFPKTCEKFDWSDADE